ncbi:hypothetical protein BH11PSE7_BH11PSE7_15660 [soil metagenome]
MYLVVIAWMYVVVMMSVAEATSTNGTLLGAIVTFLLYGVGPVGLVVYLMGSPFRRKAIKVKEATDFLAAQHAAEPVPSSEPDAGGKSPAHPIATVRKEP